MSAAHARPQLWGILNVTPDSFSDGGAFVEVDAAIAHGVRMVQQGASVIDVGGESTRPGAEPVAPQFERERVVPVVAGLAAQGIHVSIDTMHAATAAAAVGAGALIVNDVSGGLNDPDMAPLVAELEVDYVAMHWRGPSDQWDALSTYTWAPHDVRTELRARLDALLAAGIAPGRLWVDPGLGFAKNPEHNWQLLAHLAELDPLGARVLVGASRKRFIAGLLPAAAHMTERDLPTAVVGALAALAGVDALRVHDVISSSRALDVVDAWRGGWSGGGS
jgi:dihydropteroate synthase